MAERICYVTSRWGEPTQTFVRREATAVAQQVPVSALSLKRPVPANTDDAIACTHLGPVAVALGFARAAARHPVRVARVIGTVLRRARMRNVPALLVATAAGVAWAGAGRVTPQVWLHAHFGWVSAASAWAAARVAGVPYSVVLHAFELHQTALVDGFTPVPLRDAAQVFTISELDRAEVEHRWGVRPSVLRMGVPRSWLVSADAGGKDKDPDVVREPDLVVAVGSLVPKKGHDVLIDAIARAQHPWRLTIVGEGPERARLERLVDARGLGGRVSLVGLLSEAEVRALYRRAWLACLACVESPDGNRDGIPVALMEAMASGVPVVTTKLGAIPELVDGAGVLVEPGDPDQLATALDELADPSAREASAARGRRRIEDDGWLVEEQARTITGLVRS